MKIVKTLIWIVALVVLVGAGAYIVINNKKKNEAETAIVAENNNKISVNAETVKYQNLSSDYVANGIFNPVQTLDFPAEISGRVTKIFVDEGSNVGVGQVLATIRKDAIEVDASNANANYQNAVADNLRYENAFKTGGVTKQQLDQSRLQLKNAKATLQQANIKVGDATVKATISGTINKRMIEPGSVVSPGTAMFQIVNVNRLKLAVNVNESQVANLKVGDNIKIKASVYPDKEFVGKITFIAPLADASLNFPVEIEVNNSAKHDLKAGMYGTAVFSSSEDGTAKPILAISKNAFVNGVSSNQVFVINQGKVKLTKLVIGRTFGNYIEILEGLKEGEQVVTSGQINLLDGSEVEIVK